MPASAALIATITAAAVGTGTTIYAAKNQPKAPTAPSPTQNNTQLAQAQQAAAIAQANALTKRRGIASTILTSPTGTAGAAQTQTATLGT